jgi:hypothetical protein
MLVTRALLYIALMAPTCVADFWFELGDAGRTLATANVMPVTSGTLDFIFGNLSAPDPFDSALDVDLYRIYIVDPLNFSAQTVSAPGLNVSDPQLFLFNDVGNGVYMNDDDESGLNGSQSLLPAGHPFGPITAGYYYLGIGWWNNEPWSAAGRIFAETIPFGTNGPDLGAGGVDPLAGWSDDVLQRIDLETAYQIDLTGTVSAVPEPATITLLGTLITACIIMRRSKHRR